MRRAALLLLMALVLPVTVARADASAWDAVWQSESALLRATMSGRLRMMVVMEGKPNQGTAEVQVARGKLRIDFASGVRGRWTMIDDGRNLIRVRPGDRTATLMPRHPLAVDRALAERNYDARRTGAATVVGRPAQVIEIVRKSGGKPMLRLWLDKQNSFILKRERYDIDGRLTTSSEFLSVDFHAQVAANAFDIPAGYKRAGQVGPESKLDLAGLEKAMGFEVHQPRYVPSGYVLLGGYVATEAKGLGALRGEAGKSAELRYTDGIRILSIMQRPAVPRGAWRERRRGGQPVMDLADRGSEKVLRDNTGDRVILVVGDLTQEELVKVAKGVE